MKWIIGIAVAAGIAFAIALFIILPTLFTSGLLYFFPDAPMWLAANGGAEGAVLRRFTVFLGFHSHSYLFAWVILR